MAKLPSEYSVSLPIRRGMKGKSVKLVQEWLSLHGFSVKLDSDFGPATQGAVRVFQTKYGLPKTGDIDASTFGMLTSPLLRALAVQLPEQNYHQTVVKIAKQHLAEHPREIGGQNCGPWVRFYTRGYEGAAYPWCAAFASSILRQAADIHGITPPIPFTLSCDVLAANAKSAKIFIPKAGANLLVKPGDIFLAIRKEGADWTHTGLVIVSDAEQFETIEGNTNDAGDREGYEVCSRHRRWGKYDFIRV